jgi:hypothetical protein
MKTFSLVLQSRPEWILVRIVWDGMKTTRLATSLVFILSGSRIGTRSSAFGGSTALQAGRSWVWFSMVLLVFFFDIIQWSWGRPASNRNEYQGYFLACKGGRCLGLTTVPLSCADCLEIWEPQPPESLRSCRNLLLPRPRRVVCSGIWLSKQLAVRVFLLPFFFWKVTFRKEKRRTRRICRLFTSIDSHKPNAAV